MRIEEVREKGSSSTRPKGYSAARGGDQPNFGTKGGRIETVVSLRQRVLSSKRKKRANIDPVKKRRKEVTGKLRGRDGTKVRG